MGRFWPKTGTKVWQHPGPHGGQPHGGGGRPPQGWGLFSFEPQATRLPLFGRVRLHPPPPGGHQDPAQPVSPPPPLDAQCDQVDDDGDDDEELDIHHSGPS